jgi:hypothetical protein
MNQRFFTKVKKIFQHVPLVKNRARQNFIVQFVVGLLLSKKVQLSAVAEYLNDERETESNERRIQAFFQDCELDYGQVACLLALFIPKGKVSLCLDRTEWDFGKCQVNVLMLTARCGEVAVPLYWELLDNKSGNSSVADRWQLMEKVIGLLGKKRIAFLVADREFVGAEWVGKLTTQQVPFCLRLPKNHSITLRNGDVCQVKDLLAKKAERYYERVLVDGQWVNVHIKQLEEQNILYLIGTFPPKCLGVLYRKRWSIEVLFQSMKKRGFDLESTHLRSFKKLKKLLALVAIAFAFCLAAGKHYHQKFKKIPIKKHGYKEKSFFRKGLDKLRDWLSNKPIANDMFWKQAIQRFLRWLEVQLINLYPT